MNSSIAILLIAVLGLAAGEDAECGKCHSVSQAMCMTETSYYFCEGGEKFGDLYECPPGQVCTTDDNICVEKNAIPEGVVNVCGDAAASGCATCGERKNTCVSKTQGARCIRGQIAAVFNCKENEICVADTLGSSVCVPQCAADFLKQTATCTDDGPYTTPTPTTGPTLSPNDRVTICRNVADEYGDSLFFFTNVDESCKDGVYCERNALNSYDFFTVYRSCSGLTPYFDTDLRTCVAKVPASCITLTTQAQDAP